MENHKINITGAQSLACAPIINKIGKSSKALVIVPNYERAKQLASDLSFFSDKDIYLMPSEDQFFLDFKAKSNDNNIMRLRALSALRTKEELVVIAPVSACVRKIIPRDAFEEKTIKLSQGDDVDLEELKNKLIQMGYERRNQLEVPGEFSIRGSIVDIFTPDSDDPYRLDLFDTEIESIKTFDSFTQRSKEKLKYVEIHGARQLIASDELYKKAALEIVKAYNKEIEKADKIKAEKLKARKDELLEYIESETNLQLLENYLPYFYDDLDYLWDYASDGIIFIEEADMVVAELDKLLSEQKAHMEALIEDGRLVKKDGLGLIKKSEFFKAYECDRVYFLSTFAKKIEGLQELTKLEKLNAHQVLSVNGQLDLLKGEIEQYLGKGYKVHIVCSSEARNKDVESFLGEKLSRQISFEIGSISGGIDLVDDKICYFSENDIFENKKKSGRRRKFSENSNPIDSFTELEKGDYVVHENFGIGKFLGIEEIVSGDIVSDCLYIVYAGGDSLMVPVEHMDKIQKYVGADSVEPKLNKLGSGAWQRSLAKAKESIEGMTDELLELYAKRKMSKGFAFEGDTQWQREFEDSFPFVETRDQLRAIKEIKRDMEKPIAMDRLLCGDVGYGKTEVAARGIFKCLENGKQAMMLVPTTILANQHYMTLSERFQKYPFRVEMLSRFRTKAQQDKIIKAFEKGEIDFLIGTHRILSKDVKAKDLGLLVIDEEQRFGVRHKEKIKELKNSVDVLTLSATPIPRTLNMSLTGIRDMSIIEEPPVDRYPVQTYVMEKDYELIAEIIKRELKRGGQAFVVYNRVLGIEGVAKKIEELVPEAEVAVGHGQMSETQLEDIMLDFVTGKTDVLVATTIVESGIDIPNANTIIILDADKFGLAQLYQLRGRVGRSNKIAYAYLMYEKDKVLTEISTKRLKAIKDFTEFGAGFKLAMKDLEFRGAGNLLGSSQSGHMMKIGYELYCKMVDETMRKIRGEEIEEEFETKVEVLNSAYIPSHYIEDQNLKLQMYRRIAKISCREDAEDIMDELSDRFGLLPRESIQLIKVALIRAYASKLRVNRVYYLGTYIVLDFAEENRLTPYAIVNLSEKYGKRLNISGRRLPKLKLYLEKREDLDDVIEMLELIMENSKS